MKVVHVVGARPNLMKMAPAFRALALREGIEQKIVHTGQHYDANMSAIFFEQLGMPKPDVNLEVGSGSHAAQTAHIMIKFEELVVRQRPDLVLVYGDVNSTVAATLVCAKLGIKIGHVEAGLRSFDREMPEEINRLVTDQLADLLFTPSEDANENLKREGVAPEKIHFVGNLMIDTLVRLLEKARSPKVPGLNGSNYVLVTLHRPSNVDEPGMLGQIIETLSEISRELPVIFPIHPRTRQRIADARLEIAKNARLLLLEPIGYLPFLALQRDAKLVITDSGGIQEESTFLNVPCLTVRNNTERPITVTVGTNILVGQNMERLKEETDVVLQGKGKQGHAPPLWDGRAGARVAEIVGRS
jgi:UDP-N-acetylglucosamine 2-epimerase (non-hydrolysing)